MKQGKSETTVRKEQFATDMLYIAMIWGMDIDDSIVHLGVPATKQQFLKELL